MTHPVNPYIAGNPVGGGPAFVGREHVLRSVLRVLRDPQHDGVVLYGQRRIGKTSILLQLAGRLRQNGGPQAIYFDLQDKAAWSVGRIMVDLASTIAHALSLPAPQPGPDPEAWFRDAWLPQILDALPAAEPLAILVDEFDVLANADTQRAASEAFFMYLRTLLTRSAHRLRFVFVIGRNIEDLSYLAGPLFKTMPSQRVSLLLLNEAIDVVKLSERTGSLSWTPEAVERSWALTHGHPYLLQHLCWEIWQRTQEGAGSLGPIVASDVEAAAQATIDASHNMLEWLWSSLRPATRVVASALAKAGPDAITADALENVLRDSGVRVVMRELRDAPGLLQEWDIIEPSGSGYVFRVELLRRWIERYKPLLRVQQELDHVEPLAERFYKTGEILFNEGQPEQAMDQLRQALARNPNHLRASELLAEILIAKSAWDEARRILEKLHENYPAAARPRLVDVLLTQASDAQDEQVRIGLYDQVLALEPRNGLATERRRAIRKERGDRARADGELQLAATEYADAGLAELASEVTTELHRRKLDAVLAHVRDLEQKGQYVAALEAIRETGDTFALQRDWAPDIARLERARAMEADYQRATGALANGDRETAKDLLARVIAVLPGYKDAAKLLYEVVSGVSVDGLASKADVEANWRATAIRARTQTRRVAGAQFAFAIVAGALAVQALWAMKRSVTIAPVAVQRAGGEKPTSSMAATGTSTGGEPTGDASKQPAVDERSSVPPVENRPPPVGSVRFTLSAASIDVAKQEKACEANDPVACGIAGEAYYEGAKVKQNLKKSASLYSQACALRNMAGCGNLGALTLGGQGTPQNTRLGMDLLKQACGGGQAAFCATISAIYLAYDDMEQAQKYNRLACQGGWKTACPAEVDAGQDAGGEK